MAYVSNENASLPIYSIHPFIRDLRIITLSSYMDISLVQSDMATVQRLKNNDKLQEF